MRLPVAGTISTKDGTSNKNARMTNMLINQKKDVAKACVRPGLNTLVSGSGAGNNMVCFNGELVNIFGTDIKRVTASGGAIYSDPNSGTVYRKIGDNLAGAYLDQFVVTKGATRYTSNYSPECLTSGTDSLDANVVMRLRMEGVDGSTTITDDKSHAITNSGSLQIKTDQYSCGSASLKYAGGTSPSFTYSSDFDLGTGDFCIEFRIRFYDLFETEWPSVDANIFLVMQNTWALGYVVFLGSAYSEEGVCDTFGIASNTSLSNIRESFSPLAEDTWYSFAVSKQDGVIRLFMDGTLLKEEDTNTYSLTSIGTMGAGFYDHTLLP